MVSADTAASLRVKLQNLNDQPIIGTRPVGSEVRRGGIVNSSEGPEAAGSAFPAIPDFPVSLLSAIVESSSDAIISKDLTGKVTSWNKAAEQMFQFKAPEIIGRPILKIIPPELIGEEIRILQSLQRGERLEHFETVRLRKDGTRFPVSLTVSPIRNPQGQVIGASKIARDITAQRKAAENNRLLASIVDSSDDAIISKNLSGIVTSWNAAATRIFGYTAAEAIGRHISFLIPLDRMEEEQLIIGRLARGERIDHFQTLRKCKDGQLLHVSLTISPIRDISGIVVGASKIARDVTELVEAERALLDAHAALADFISRTDVKLGRIDLNVTMLEALQQFPVFRAPHQLVSMSSLAAVIGHEPFLHQAISNLLANIVNSVPVGEVPELKIWTEVAYGFARLKIKHAGAGIYPAAQHRQLRRLEKIGSQYSDTAHAPGLAMAKKTIERMNGRVGMESDGTAGPLYWIELPAAD